MATLSITKQWANGEVLLEADLDYIKSDTETFLNTTKINDDNIQTGGITGSTKLADLSISAAKLATDSVTTAKILDLNVTTGKIADLAVTQAKMAAALMAVLLPPGTIYEYAGSSLPSGYLWPNGDAVSRTTYAALFTAIGTTYGVGDGTTTFNLPDKRGRVAAGKDDMGGTSANRLTNQSGGLNGDSLGATGGAETHTLSIAESAAHDHGGSTGSTNLDEKFVTDDGLNAVKVYVATPASEGQTSHSHSISSQGGGGAHNNVQPTIILNYIIKT